MTKRLFSLAVMIAFSLTVSSTLHGQDEKEKWVALFNGKDLTGWKTHPDDKAKWEVQAGEIVGTGPAGHLFSERGDYKNFKFRMEVSISDKGNSGQYFRTKFAKAFPPGLEAQINSTHGDKVRTGSLYGVKGCLVYEQLVKPDTWFTQEVTAIGDHVVVKVNGKETVNVKLPADALSFSAGKFPASSFKEGHFAIQQHDPGSKVKIRKIEVIELP